MNVDIDMSEVNALAAELAAKVAELKPEVTRIVSEAANEFRDAARNAAPERTGELKKSIQILGGGQSGGGAFRDVGSRLRYARYVEFGTYKDRPQPYLYRTIPPIERKMFEELYELGFPF